MRGWEWQATWQEAAWKVRSCGRRVMSESRIQKPTFFQLTSPSTRRSLFLSDRKNVTRSAMFASALCVKLRDSSEGVMNEFASSAALTASAHGPLSKTITHSCFLGDACDEDEEEEEEEEMMIDRWLSRFFHPIRGKRKGKRAKKRGGVDAGGTGEWAVLTTIF